MAVYRPDDDASPAESGHATIHEKGDAYTAKRTTKRGRPAKVTPLHAGGSPVYAINPEAERNFLGSIMCAPGEEEIESALDLIKSSDFDTERYRVICEAMQELRGEGKPAGDIVLLDEWLRQRGRLTEAGGQTAVNGLANEVKTANHVHEYARILVRLSAQRVAMREATNFVMGATTPERFEGGSLEAFWTQFKARMETQLDRLANVSGDMGNGFTAAELRDMELPETRWIVPDILPVGLTLLAAKQKIGKSWWALSVALSVALGARALGAKDVEGGDVLYLALEDNKSRIKRRIAQLLQGDSDWPARLRVELDWPRLDQGGYRKIEQWLINHPNRRMLIIDVLAKVRTPRAKHGDIYAEDYALMTPLKDLADAYNVAIVVIHHTRKASAEDVFDEIRDSAGLTAACDAVMVLQRPRNDDNGTLHITGRDVDEAQYALRIDRTSGQWNLLGDAQELGLSDARREIVELLRRAKRPMTPLHIAESLGKNHSTVKNLLPKMVADRQVINKYNGMYAVDSIDSIDSIDRVDSIDSVYRSYESTESTKSTREYRDIAVNTSEGVRSAVYAWAKRHAFMRIRHGENILIDGDHASWEAWLRSHDNETVAQLWQTLRSQP